LTRRLTKANGHETAGGGIATGSGHMAAASIGETIAFFYRAGGRIGRQEYALGLGVVWAIDLAILAYVVNGPGLTPEGVATWALVSLPLTVALFVIVAKRCHDLGLPGSFVLLVFVPAAGLFWLLALLLIPGSAGANLYGPAPSFRPE
jgi:uncharacterized membrane protein YhaH (DUF805 family)